MEDEGCPLIFDRELTEKECEEIIEFWKAEGIYEQMKEEFLKHKQIV